MSIGALFRWTAMSGLAQPDLMASAYRFGALLEQSKSPRCSPRGKLKWDRFQISCGRRCSACGWNLDQSIKTGTFFVWCIPGFLDPGSNRGPESMHRHVIAMTNSLAPRGPDDEGAWVD